MLDGNQNGVIVVRAGNSSSNGNEAEIQLQAEEFDLMAAEADLDEIEEVNANCILMANLQQASTSSTQTDKAPVIMTQTITPKVRILQKSQENGQSRTNTDTGTELSVQEPGECYQRSTKGFMGASSNLQGLEASPDGYK
ncbi:hypothetical protein Tco_0316367 [Tanacetum coccineum]